MKKYTFVCGGAWRAVNCSVFTLTFTPVVRTNNLTHGILTYSTNIYTTTHGAICWTGKCCKCAMTSNAWFKCRRHKGITVSQFRQSREWRALKSRLFPGRWRQHFLQSFFSTRCERVSSQNTWTAPRMRPLTSTVWSAVCGQSSENSCGNKPTDRQWCWLPSLCRSHVTAQWHQIVMCHCRPCGGQMGCTSSHLTSLSALSIDLWPQVSLGWELMMCSGHFITNTHTKEVCLCYGGAAKEYFQNIRVEKIMTNIIIYNIFEY